MDRGYDVNRTVFTIIGIVDDLLLSIKKLISFSEMSFDIKNHVGIHPRIGIVDVIPFIPICNISSADLKIKVREYFKKLAVECRLPIFYYGQMATMPQHTTLAQLRRKRSKEDLAQDTSAMISDEGPKLFHPRLGASCVTVRDFMVAFNINLDEPDLSQAKDLAKALRNNRSTKKDIDMIDLEDVRFIAWHMPSFAANQISMNLYNVVDVDLLSLYTYVEKVAASKNIKLTGAELIGITPQSAICKKEQNLDQAIKYMGLDSVKPFTKEEHILEFILPQIVWNKKGH